MVNQDFEKFKEIQKQHPSIYLGNSAEETKRNEKEAALTNQRPEKK